MIQDRFLQRKAPGCLFGRVVQSIISYMKCNFFVRYVREDSVIQETASDPIQGMWFLHSYCCKQYFKWK